MGDVLALLPEADDPAGLMADLALVWRLTLGPTERLALAAAGHFSLDADASKALAEAALTDVSGAGREAERMQRQWIAHCSDSRRARR